MWGIKVTLGLRLFDIGVTPKKAIKSTCFSKKVTGYALFLLMRKIKNKYKYLHVYRLFRGVTPQPEQPNEAKPSSHKALRLATNKNSGVTMAQPFAYWCDAYHPSHISHYIKKTGDSITFNQIRV